LRRLGGNPPNSNVLIVDVDEPSLARYGQWPWPRHLVAQLLNIVRDGNPDAVGVDILFAEPDRSSLKFVNKELKAGFGTELDIANLPPELVDHDWALSRTLHRGSFYLGVMFRFGEGIKIHEKLPDSQLGIVHVSRKGEGEQSFPIANSVVAAIPQLAVSADGLGFVNAVPDADGVIRRVPLFIRYGDALYPSLALTTYMRFIQSKTVVTESDSQGLISIKAGDALIPVDKQGFVFLRFRGPSKTYPYISAADVLDGKISQDIFNRKIVFVGSSAEGLRDIHTTPFDLRFSGVEIHATMVGALLDHDFISVPTWSTGVQGVGALMAALLALAMVLWFSTWATGLALFCFIIFIPVSSATLLASYQVFVSPVPTMLAFIFSFILLTLTRLRSDELRVLSRERQLAAARDCAILGWASLAETRDPETGNHIFRTQKYIRAMAQRLVHHKNLEYRIQPQEVDLLFKSSPLHDVGKIGVPDSILLKPGPLTPSEFEEMKKHTLYGTQALVKAESASGITDDTSFLKIAREIILTHHEKWDGTGYPHGLEGKNIPLSGRLMALADVYDALISDRVYKKAMSHEAAANIIRNGRGTHFDPELVDIFETLEGEFLAINLEHADPKE
jgi:HD-GYP domain-containing protein (c-di-GMP phosphodiesterase class II)